jgi:hypothetical protein
MAEGSGDAGGGAMRFNHEWTRMDTNEAGTRLASNGSRQTVVRFFRFSRGDRALRGGESALREPKRDDGGGNAKGGGGAETAGLCDRGGEAFRGLKAEGGFDALDLLFRLFETDMGEFTVELDRSDFVSLVYELGQGDDLVFGKVGFHGLGLVAQIGRVLERRRSNYLRR